MIRFIDGVLPLLDDIDKVRQHPDNANNGDTDEIVESIERNQMYGAILAQTSTGYILRGNHTYAACLELGSQTIPVIWYDCDDTTAKRILTADNAIARKARIDPAQEHRNLLDLIEGSKSIEEALAGSGYTSAEYERLAMQIAEPIPVPSDHPWGDTIPSGNKCPECGHEW